MAERGISGLPVVDAGGRLAGMVSEADLIRLETTFDPRSQASPVARSAPVPQHVADVMSREPVTVDADDDLALAAQLMLEAGVKRLPVLEGGRLVGVVSRHDVVRVVARPDASLAEAVRRVLADEGMGMADLDVSVRGGVVELRGQAEQKTLRLAEALARTVPGVLDVRLSP
jgi:CBS-domain-containing membrane protein